MLSTVLFLYPVKGNLFQYANPFGILKLCRYVGIRKSSRFWHLGAPNFFFLSSMDQIWHFSGWDQRLKFEISVLQISCQKPYVVKFIYSEKATQFCEISTVDLTITTQDKSKLVISQNFCVLLIKPQLYYDAYECIRKLNIRFQITLRIKK